MNAKNLFCLALLLNFTLACEICQAYDQNSRSKKDAQLKIKTIDANSNKLNTVNKLGATLNSQISTALLNCKKTTISPVIDGVIDSKDPWDSTNWVPILKDQYDIGGDMSAKFQLLWDNLNLYIAVKVIDNTRFINAATVRINDGVTVYITKDTLNKYNYEKMGAWCFLKASNDAILDFSLLNNYEKVQFKCHDNIDYYIQEFAIPWESLNAYLENTWNSNFIKFEIAVTNCTADEYPTQFLFWSKAGDYSSPWLPGGLVKLVDSLSTPVHQSELVNVCIYPNPVSHILKCNNKNGIKLAVIDMKGTVLLSANATELNIAKLKPGLYICRISTNTGIKAVKFLKN